LLAQTEIVDSAKPDGLAQKATFQLPADNVQEKILMADKNSIADSINSVYSASIDTALPVPEELSISRSRKGWEIKWNAKPTSRENSLKFSIMVFHPVKGGGFLKKVFSITGDKSVFIPRKSEFNPSKVLFGIVSISDKGYQSPFPKLFHIRGRRIIFN
jgi:hypothetical protein